MTVITVGTGQPGTVIIVNDPNNPGQKIDVFVPPTAKAGQKMAVPIPGKGETVQSVQAKQKKHDEEKAEKAKAGGWSTGAKVAAGGAAVVGIGAVGVGGVILGDHLAGGDLAADMGDGIVDAGEAVGGDRGRRGGRLLVAEHQGASASWGMMNASGRPVSDDVAAILIVAICEVVGPSPWPNSELGGRLSLGGLRGSADPGRPAEVVLSRGEYAAAIVSYVVVWSALIALVAATKVDTNYTYEDIREQELKCKADRNREWKYDAATNTWACPLQRYD